MVNKIIDNWYKAQKAGAWLPCPRCGKLTMKEDLHTNAFSRRADVYVCDKCGMAEAIEDVPHKDPIFGKFNKLPVEAWFVYKTIYGQPYFEQRDDDAYNVDINRRVFLTQEDIDDILDMALDGGITYWCDSAEIGEAEYLGEWANEQIACGGTLILHNREDNKEYTLTLEKFLNGFAIACRKGYSNCLEWFSGDSIDIARMDAEAADVIVQCSLFGDAIYG